MREFHAPFPPPNTFPLPYKPVSMMHTHGNARTITATLTADSCSTNIDLKLNVLRAAEEITVIEKRKVHEEAKAEVTAAKKELRTLSKRMDQQCTREVRVLYLSTDIWAITMHCVAYAYGDYMADIYVLVVAWFQLSFRCDSFGFFVFDPRHDWSNV